jgi:hypothetical protein
MKIKAAILIVLILVLVIAGKAYYDTNSIEIRHYEIRDTRLADALSGLKIAFLSDLHTRRMGDREQRILNILQDEKPDIILLGGDQVSFKGSYEPVTAFLDQLSAPLGVYAVLGNTEYSNENGSCILCHEAGSANPRHGTSWTFLKDSTTRLRIRDTEINLMGLDDPVRRRDKLRTALRTVDPNAPTILLAHSPEVFEEAVKVGVDMVLSGHTHGGQIFLTRLLQKVIPLEEALEYLDGFFQKGKTLMYVSRGIGTSFLPFRLGVKPEITFFKFSNDANEKIRMVRIDRAVPTNPVSISNSPPTLIFTGFSFSTLIETFNVFESLGLTALPRSSALGSQHSTLNTQHLTLNTSLTLFDFESPSDLDRLNWECGKWFEVSEKYATSGKHSLRALLPSGQYPGISFEGIPQDWSGKNYLNMDVCNPSDGGFSFHVRIDDNKSGWEYSNRFDVNFQLKPGMNHISVPVNSIKTNLHSRPLNLKGIKRMMVFIPNSPVKRELYVDNIRLE